MKRTLPIALALVFALSVLALPVLAHEPGSAFEMTAVKVSKAPDIDGVLNDAAWLDAALTNAVATGFVDHTGSILLQKQTVVYAAWDAEALYFAYINYRDMDKVIMIDDGTVTFGSEEENELYFDVDHQHILHVQYAWDAFGNPWASSGVTSDIEVATSQHDFGWIAEVKLPFSALGIDNPAEGMLIGMNLNGYSTDDNAYFAWSPTFGSFANPPMFGGLVLGPAR